MIEKASPLIKILEIIKKLRGENGCSWDKKQTPKTMTIYLIEEIHELVEAINSGEPDAVLEELGDVLFLIIFVAYMFETTGHFNLMDVADKNCEKMINRHPHVFGDKKGGSIEDIRKRWHAIKMKEKNHGKSDSLLDAIPSGLPALIRAYRISERAAKTGFDWDNISDVMEKVNEEFSEFKTELSANNKTKKNTDKAAMEFGDILFTLVNVARFAHFHPETALTSSINKFEKRFKHMEKSASQKGLDLESLTREEMDIFWNESKKNVTISTDIN